MIHGLFCGVSKYRNGDNLDFCLNDPYALAKAFTKNVIMEYNNIIFAAPNGEIDNTDYLKQLKEFCMNANEEDLIIIYYSGHGGVDENGDNYLCASNSFNEYTRIYLDQVINYITQSKAKSSLVILDCCHADNKYNNYFPRLDIQKVVDEIYQAGITVFSSCKSDETSYPYTDGLTSAFTQFLCSALNNHLHERDGYLYFNDLKLTIEFYAKVWARKHPDLIQTPILRSNMLGTIALPLRNPKKKKKRDIFPRISTDLYDIENIEFDMKAPRDVEQKVYLAKIILKVPISEENILYILKNIINKIRTIQLPPTNWRQQRVFSHQVEVIFLWVANDLVDYNAGLWPCRAIWACSEKEYWLNHLGRKSICIDDISFIKNDNYIMLKNDRLNNTLTDEEINDFWNFYLLKVIEETGKLINKYNEYKAGDVELAELMDFSISIIRRLNPIYEKIDNVPFTLPNSKLEKYDKKCEELASTARGLPLIFTSKDRSENNIIECFELDLNRYYRIFREWDDARPK